MKTGVNGVSLTKAEFLELLYLHHYSIRQNLTGGNLTDCILLGSANSLLP